MSALKLYSLLSAWVFLHCAHAQQGDYAPHANGKLYYHSYGSGEVVVLLSGGPGSSYRQVEPMAVVLSGKYRVVVPEQRGTGRSIPVPFDSTTITLAAAQDDISLLLATLKVKKAILVGHSWGARLALSYACRYPDRVKELILVSPGIFNASLPMRTIVNDIIEERMSEQDIEAFVAFRRTMQAGTITAVDALAFDKLQTKPFVYDLAQLDSLYTAINTGGANEKTQGLILSDLQRVSFNLTPQLPLLRVPVAVVCGREDPLAFVAYEIKLLLPATRLVWIERCGHFPMFEQPGALATAVQTALNKPVNK